MNADERILRERAVILAREPQPEAAADRTDYLVFTCAGRTIAVGSEYAAEAVPAKGIFTVPGAPPHVVGGLNHRGRMIAILSLPILLGLPQGAADQAPYPLVIVLRPGGAAQEVGFQASTLVGFTSIAPGEIGGLRGSTLKWVAGMSGAGTLILDAGPMLEAITNGSGRI
jgi:chemotaxis signal transduction protein